MWHGHLAQDLTVSLGIQNQAQGISNYCIKFRLFLLLASIVLYKAISSCAFCSFSWSLSFGFSLPLCLLIVWHRVISRCVLYSLFLVFSALGRQVNGQNLEWHADLLEVELKYHIILVSLHITNKVQGHLKAFYNVGHFSSSPPWVIRCKARAKRNMGSRTWHSPVPLAITGAFKLYAFSLQNRVMVWGTSSLSKFGFQ